MRCEEREQKNRAKRSSSTSRSSSALPTTKKNIGFSYGIGPDDIPAEGEDTVIKYHNWNEFQEKLDDLEEKKSPLRQEAREWTTNSKKSLCYIPRRIYEKFCIHCRFKK
jgi:hypothetical protein